MVQQTEIIVQKKNVSIFLAIRIGETVTTVIPNILVIEILG